MAMTLYFKRAKSFVVPSEDRHGERKFIGMPGPNPMTVPNWVADTQTFKDGIRDKSIVNLTPPDQMPGYKAPVASPAPLEALEEAPKAPESVPEEVDVEQKEVPEAPFGAQPMTPVAPAPKVGSVRASARKVQS